jgi:hypothetical protein
MGQKQGGVVLELRVAAATISKTAAGTPTHLLSHALERAVKHGAREGAGDVDKRAAHARLRALEAGGQPAELLLDGLWSGGGGGGVWLSGPAPGSACAGRT